MPDVERVLGLSAATTSWANRGVWMISSVGPAQMARLDAFEDRFEVFRSRLGIAAPVSSAAGSTYRLTRYAHERVDACEVLEAWIAEALRDPEREAPDPHRPGITLSWKRIPAFGDRTLRVAHRPEDGQICVLTAFFDRGAAP